MRYMYFRDFFAFKSSKQIFHWLSKSFRVAFAKFIGAAKLGETFGEKIDHSLHS